MSDKIIFTLLPKIKFLNIMFNIAILLIIYYLDINRTMYYNTQYSIADLCLL